MFAVAISVSFYRSGGGTDSDGDIFIALSVFLPLATLVSAASIGSNIWLLLRQAVFRRAQLQALARQSARPTSARRLQLAWLVNQLMLRRDEDAHREEASRNDIALRQFSLGMLLLLLEDIPLFAIQLTLIRTNPTQVELLPFLNMLKTSGMLATKLQHLKSLPDLLKRRRTLGAERVELDRRAAQLQVVSTGGSAPGESDMESDSESTGALYT